MRKSLKAFITLLSSGVILSGCDFDLNSLKFNKLEKTIVEEEEPTKDTSSGEGEGSEGSETEEISFDCVKNYAVSVASKIIGIAEEEVKCADYFDDTVEYYPDVYTCNKENLIFASAFLDLDGVLFLDAIDLLKEYLPEDSVYEEELSEPIDEFYEECDLWYKSGSYYYIINCNGYNFMEFTFAKFDIVPVFQAQEYINLVYGEDGSDFDDYGDLDWNQFLSSLQ